MTKSELIARLTERLNQRGTTLSSKDCEFAGLWHLLAVLSSGPCGSKSEIRRTGQCSRKAGAPFQTRKRSASARRFTPLLKFISDSF